MNCPICLKEIRYNQDILFDEVDYHFRCYDTLRKDRNTIKGRKKGGSDAPYMIMLNQNVCEIPTPDRILKSLEYELTNEQKSFIIEHKHLDRTILHRKLDKEYPSLVSRLRMTMFLDQTFGKPIQYR